MDTTDDVMRLVVMPAIQAVFDEGEVEAVDLVRDDWGDYRVEIVVHGERFEDAVVQAHVEPTSTEEWRERLRSNLVDFVAESRFGWGEHRGDRSGKA